jgi:hypothetical protein
MITPITTPQAYLEKLRREWSVAAKSDPAIRAEKVRELEVMGKAVRALVDGGLS